VGGLGGGVGEEIRERRNKGRKLQRAPEVRQHAARGGSERGTIALWSFLKREKLKRKERWRNGKRIISLNGLIKI